MMLHKVVATFTRSECEASQARTAVQRGGGQTERLHQAPHGPAIPSLLNVTPLSVSLKKTEDLRLPVLNYRWNSCITTISKPRLHESKGASDPTER